MSKFRRRLNPAILGLSPPDLYKLNVLSLAPLAYWPLDETSGTTAFDRSGNGYNATHDTDTVLGAAGQSGFACTYPANSATNIYSAGFAGAFSGAAGTMACWARLAAPEWIDGVGHNAIYIYADASNYAYIHKMTTNNNFRGLYAANGTVNSVTVGTSGNTNWFHYALTWSAAADQVIVYYNGTQSGLTQTGLGVWAGVPAAANTAIGNSRGDGTSTAFIGSIQHVAVWTRALTPTEIANLYGWAL